MDTNVNILENNVKASFSNAKTEILGLQNSMKQSFPNAKTDINALQDKIRQQDETIKQFYDYIRQLNDNQKALLLRLREIEKKAAEKPAERVLEKSIILTAPKTAPTEPNHYVGSATSSKVHNKICPFAKNIKPKNKVIFLTKEKAFNQGYKACDCLKKV